MQGDVSSDSPSTLNFDLQSIASEEEVVKTNPNAYAGCPFAIAGVVDAGLQQLTQDTNNFSQNFDPNNPPESSNYLEYIQTDLQVLLQEIGTLQQQEFDAQSRGESLMACLAQGGQLGPCELGSVNSG